MSMTYYLHKLLAGSGWKSLRTTTASDISHYGVSIITDSIIETWVDEDDLDLVDFFNIEGLLLTKEHIPLIIPNNKKSTSIKLSTAGEVLLLRSAD